MICFLGQRLDRALEKVKDERATAVAEKSRVDKEIRRILTAKDRITKENAERERAIVAEKERVDAESLKYIFPDIRFLFSLSFFF